MRHPRNETEALVELRNLALDSLWSRPAALRFHESEHPTVGMSLFPQGRIILYPQLECVASDLILVKSSHRVHGVWLP